MPVTRQFETNESARQDAEERQTVLALSKVGLFKSDFLPTPLSTAVDFATNECDFTGYVQKTLTAWNEPILAPSSGYLIESPLVQWGPLADPVTVPNIAGGAWVEDAAGIIRAVIVFGEPVNFQVPGQGLPLSIVISFPAPG